MLRKYAEMKVTFLLSLALYATATNEPDADDFSPTTSQRLMAALIRKRGPDIVRPKRLVGDPVDVRFKMELYQVIELNERQQYVSISAWVIERWYDEFIFWDPARYDNITEVKMHHSTIWIPDTTLYNTRRPLFYLVNLVIPTFIITLIAITGWFYMCAIIIISVGALAASFVISVQKFGLVGERLPRKAVKLTKFFSYISLTRVPPHIGPKMGSKNKHKKVEERTSTIAQFAKYIFTAGTEIPAYPHWSPYVQAYPNVHPASSFNGCANGGEPLLNGTGGVGENGVLRSGHKKPEFKVNKVSLTNKMVNTTLGKSGV
ncbi:hypothetical protein TELCIR_04638 [Teladorsagia circumcincta]|uniref:Neurotransmitter-gated ion-channel ligand-binding domain-containing protein n=1 Tax=Teladorsagia circumcincta TaxID=45464 RepID=A0A2G9UT25_TELCI|nr:hypothetical protein TELCIR_04638 [Teladorsagia circumcincta]